MHKEVVVVCVLRPDGEEGDGVVKSFGTFRGELTRMRGWLKQLRVTEIAMESTGVYWRPVWNVLEEEGFRLLLVNPAQVKALQGRKSDARDCRRIVEFLQDGRLDASFVPTPEFRELRTLVRDRVSLLEDRNEVHNRIRDVLETANVKLSSVATNLMGGSGQRIVRALAAGEESAERLSWKVRGRLRRKERTVKESLKGYVTEFHRELLRRHLAHYDFLTAQVAELEARIEARMAPYAELLDYLVTIPGVDRVVAWTLLAELGPDMGVFPDADHCASWAGLAPGTYESGGKLLSGRTKKGNRALRRILTQAAWAASRCKEGYLPVLFRRWKGRLGWSKAIVAVAHKLLIIAYSILRDRTPYRELGSDYFGRLHPERFVRAASARAARLGYRLVLEPIEGSGG